MTLPWTIYRYLTLQAVIGIVGLFLILSGLILLIDLIESLREVEKIEDAGFNFALKLTLLRAPKLALTLTPFIFLFGTMWAFYQLNRRSEIAVMRSAGMSVWRIISPVALLSLCLGVIILTLLDPLASRMSAQADAEKNSIRGKSTQLLTTVEGDIWVRQRTDDLALILHAEKYNLSQRTLSDVTIWKRDLQGVFIERWDADKVVLENKQFVLADAYRSRPGDTKPVLVEAEIIPSAFDLEDLREDIAKPDSLSIWTLRDFTQVIEDAGLPIVAYQLRYHDLISLPVKLMAMVLIAALFSMKPLRSGGTLPLILSGIAAGFVLFISSELSNATAEAQVAPVWLAAWAPAAIAVLLSLTMLLYTEDG
ncbi:MAG: LPS export ABC transporter permease LptG [Aquisalinus sp.]|nr:LPS export ABC transporter permease LptG [Aquisalinus sp.]